MHGGTAYVEATHAATAPQSCNASEYFSFSHYENLVWLLRLQDFLSSDLACTHCCMAHPAVRFVRRLLHPHATHIPPPHTPSLPVSRANPRRARDEQRNRERVGPPARRRAPPAPRAVDTLCSLLLPIALPLAVVHAFGAVLLPRVRLDRHHRAPGLGGVAVRRLKADVGDLREM